GVHRPLDPGRPSEQSMRFRCVSARQPPIAPVLEIVGQASACGGLQPARPGPSENRAGCAGSVGEAHPCSTRAEARRRLKPAPRFLRLFGILLGIVLAAGCSFSPQPSYETALYLGQCQMARLQYEKAITFLESAMSLADAQSKSTPLHLLGQSYLRMAEKIVNSQTQAHPDSSHTRLAAARIFESQDRYQVAALMLLETAKLDPMNASVFFPLARMLAILGLEDASQLALGRYRSLMVSDRQATIDAKTLPRSHVAEIGTKVDFVGILRALPPAKAPSLPMI